jgi:hypothetical protein
MFQGFQRSSSERRVRVLVLAIIVVSGAWSLAAQSSQPPVRILNPTNPNPTPGDARMTQFDFEVKGASWRVFAVDSLPEGPIAVVQVNEVRQHNPPSTWAVHVTNRELQTVASFTMIAAVVDIAGEIKAIQALPPIKNLKPGQVQRRETRIRVTVIAPTDRVVFYVRDVISETGNLRASEIDVAAIIKSAASQLPVP